MVDEIDVEVGDVRVRVVDDDGRSDKDIEDVFDRRWEQALEASEALGETGWIEMLEEAKEGSEGNRAYSLEELDEQD